MMMVKEKAPNGAFATHELEPRFLVLGAILLSEGVDDVAVGFSPLGVSHVGNRGVIGLQRSLDVSNRLHGKRNGDVGIALDFDDGIGHDETPLVCKEEAYCTSRKTECKPLPTNIMPEVLEYIVYKCIHLWR